VQRGAHRIESNYGTRDTVTNAAFLNPDGTTVLVVVNQTDREQPFVMSAMGAQAHAEVPAGTVATYVW
jgi:glucosylceramidase